VAEEMIAALNHVFFKRRQFLLFGGSSILSLSFSKHSSQYKENRDSHAILIVNNGNTILDGTYQVTIEMSQESVDALNQSNYSLYCFKALQCWDKAGVPIVWKKHEYSKNNVLEILEAYEAYTSHQELKVDTNINSGNFYPINIGQTLEVQTVSGTGQVKKNGITGAISIYNNTQTKFTSGILAKTGDSFNPICAFPLFGYKTQVIIPLNKILLLFSTTQVKAGSAIVKAESFSILIDLTKSQKNRCTVSYDINKGWKWDGGIWAQTFPPSTNLTEVLIADPPPDFHPGILSFS
jgi:hypothetical protein